MKKSLRSHLINTLIIAIVGFPTGLAFCSSCWKDFDRFVQVGFYSSALWVFLWKGNEAVSNGLDFKISWAKNPVRRLTLGILGHLIYTLAATFMINYAAYLMYGLNYD